MVVIDVPEEPGIVPAFASLRTPWCRQSEVVVEVDDDTAAFRRALQDLVAGASENIARGEEILDRATWLAEQLETGRALVEVVEEEQEPRIVEMLSQNLETLQVMGARFRIVEARTLREQGVPNTVIARLFGVTPQRISALVQQSAPFEGDGA